MNAEKLRALKCNMFAERATTDEVLDWIEAAMPKEYKAAAMTGAFMMFNTVLELLAQMEENGETE